MPADRLTLDARRSSPDAYLPVATSRRKGTEDVGARKDENEQTITDKRIAEE